MHVRAQLLCVNMWRECDLGQGPVVGCDEPAGRLPFGSGATGPGNVTRILRRALGVASAGVFGREMLRVMLAEASLLV